jgi:hypothetical protein
VLEVVEEKEELLLAQVLGERLEERPTGLLLEAEAVGDRGRDERGVGEGGKGDEEDTVGDVLDELGPRLEGEAGLAGPACSGEGEQAHVDPPEERSEGREFALSADERRRLGREVGGRLSSVRTGGKSDSSPSTTSS